MTNATELRPTLLPGLTRLWRGTHTIQLGLAPGRAFVVDLPDPRAVQLLELLDGAHTERSVLAHAGRIGIDATDARTLIASLRSVGLVVGAQSLPGPLPEWLAAEAAALALRGAEAPGRVVRRRLDARVLVTGRGRLAAPVAVALAAAGVGHVRPELPGPVRVTEALDHRDVGRPRTEAAIAAIERAAPGTRTTAVPEPTFVVQAGIDRPAALLAAGFARRRLAHLLVDTRDGTPVIGPLVPPIGGPCLNCLDLHRTERDPGWPELAAQLAGDHRGDPCSAPTVLAAVGYAAAEVLTYIDGGTPETVGAAVEIAAPGRIRRRAWPPNSACSCTRTRAQGAVGAAGRSQ
jgi:bacteriocin biosynthesis cyclodehydratase domain-containing protein